LFKTANQEVLQAILPVLDDFDRAWVQIEKSEEEALVQGVALIHEKLKSTLVGKGLEQIDLKPGDKVSYSKFAGTEYEDYLIIPYKDIYAVLGSDDE
jgi:molecular chaperone GrpE (heat shock protein)